jgi:hypothetical protein
MKYELPAEGFEPTHSCEYWILSPARLPVPPRRLVSLPFRIGSGARKFKLLNRIRCTHRRNELKECGVPVLVSIFKMRPISFAVILLLAATAVAEERGVQ